MNETQIGKLVINLQIKTDALEQGLSTAKKKIQELESQNKELENSNKSLDASFVAMSVAAVAALGQIKGIITDCVNEYNEYTQAMSSLDDVAQYTNQDMDDLGKIMSKFSNYMTKSDIAATIKNFSLMGYTAEETEKMMDALTNSAIKNRNANYTVSQAVKVASDGYKQGLSTLSDSAGVTENLSVMLDEYAKSIGKTAGQLTEAEKNQAYLNRTMNAAEPFAGAMEGYMDSLAGKQGAYNNAMKETQVTYAEAIEPMMTKALQVGTELLDKVNSFISQNPSLVAGLTTFAITLGVVTVAVLAIKKAKDAYEKSTLKATIAQKGFNAALMANPIFLVITALTTALSIYAAYTAAVEENAKAKAKNEEITRRYKEMEEDLYGFSEKNIQAANDDTEKIKEQIELQKERLELSIKMAKLLQEDPEKAVKAAASPMLEHIGDDLEKEYWKVAKALQSNDKALKEAIQNNGNYGDSLDELSKKLKNNADYLEEADSVKKISAGLDTKAIKNKQKEAAQQKINAQTMQDYLNTVKQGNTATAEYQEAVKKLAEAYPEAATASGILTDVAQQNIDAAGMQADSAWAAAQTEINSYISIIQAALNSEAVQKQVAENVGISVDALVPKLQNVLNLYQSMANMAPTDVPNITPTSVSSKKSSGGGSYQNKALDNYKKQIEHKKALDQLSLNDEIAMYETALKKYAKKADEKNEIREKIYELNKELAKKEKEILEQQTEDYENYMEEQKSLRGAAYNVQEQTEDYDKIIRMHKSYLDQIMKDERLSLDERKEIYRDELQTIRDYEKEKRELRVSSVDNTVSQLTSAITKQLEELHEKDKELIDKNIEAVEKWKKARIDAINEEYDARIEAIERELEALDQAEKQKTRDEEDAEYERKRNRLQDLIDYEHDATTKANYQKELDKLVTEHQKTLNARALSDKKDALSKEKELLKDEQDQLVQSVEKSADEQIDAYNDKLDELDKYYEKQISMAQENAEKMLLNVDQNQDKILNLLRNYGDKYEITGQSLGEKLAQGINEGLSNKIQNVIQRVQNTIDSNLESKISEWSSSGYNYTSNANKPNSNGINVIQNNYIQQTPEMPSETYRKLRNIDEELASSLARL